MARRLKGMGIECTVTAPGMLPKMPSDRVKTDRREALPAELDAYAHRAGRRLNRKFVRLLHAGKPSQVAAIAVARELSGFIWGAMTGNET